MKGTNRNLQKTQLKPKRRPPLFFNAAHEKRVLSVQVSISGELFISQCEDFTDFGRFRQQNKIRGW